jgi:uncharacterized protein with HEPN domain
MQRNQADEAFIWDMADAAKAVRDFVARKTFHDYVNDRMLRNAVERNVEIIGEAANQVSRGFRKAHPEIPWRQLIAQRHVLAHEYGEIKHELLWRMATIRLPPLIAELERLLSPPPASE